jgi:adenosylcobinamide hydrolase
MEIVFGETGGEIIWREEDTLVLEFPRPRLVCSTSSLNGGISEGIRAVFNQECPPVDTAQELPGGSVKAYFTYIAQKRGLKPEETTGLLTAASQQNAAVSCLSFRDLTVLAVATAGIDHNGGRPGDPASYYEENGRFHLLAGTINILLAVNACLPPPTLLKAIITATEAKTSALLELLAPSCYSVELATGSGTDGIIIAADPTAGLELTDAGHHSKLGELIGKTVREAIKKALELETGFTPERQLNLLARLKRYGIDERLIWEDFQNHNSGRLAQDYYSSILNRLAVQPELVSCFSSVVHLADQVRWGLLPLEAAWTAAQGSLRAVGIEPEQAVSCSGHGAGKEIPLIQALIKGLHELVLKEAS